MVTSRYIKRCKFRSDDTVDEKTGCPHSQYEGGELCVFHSLDVSTKQDDFRDALERLIDARKQSGALTHRFDGFIFPAMDFGSQTFTKKVKFINCRFAGKADFSDCKFNKSVMFAHTEFSERPVFTSAQFRATTTFWICTFNDASSFTGCRFNRALFTYCRFGGTATFEDSTFLRGLTFTKTSFEEDASFWGCVFRDTVRFKDVRLARRAEFRGSKFKNEITFNNSTIGFLKSLPMRDVDFGHTVLESAHIWENDALERCSFRDSFILSLNLADKAIIDCDFTGAVFKAVLTEGWRPDEKTIHNTKYIYTDYEIVDEKDEEGDEVKVYRRTEESRVPAEGNFGEGEHEGFTVADYLKEPLKWSFALNVPPQFRTAVLNYIQFFTDFMNVTEGVNVEIRTRQEGGKIRVEFMTDTREEKELVQKRFEEYRDNTTKDFNSLVIRFNNERASELERELFLIKYELQVNNLKTELSYTQKLLAKEEEKNRLQEKYLSLLQQANVFVNQPQKLLTASTGAERQLYETPVYFLTADLKGYSDATQQDAALYKEIQSFLFEQTGMIEQEAGCELVKLEGDCIKVWFRDGLKLVRLARKLINSFEDFKFENPSGIEGFRVILGYGTGHREQRGGRVDFSGDFIIETVRVDQPMKKYLAEHGEDSNQIWCTEAFREQMQDKHRNVKFERLPFMSLDKGYSREVVLYRVKVV